ncbi:MAG: hypothetical protein ACUZ8E_17530 [Candidatus Anammoxibacter sp.]
MVDTKISALTDGAPILGTDELVLARSGANVKADVSDLLKAGANNTLFISSADVVVANTVVETTLIAVGAGSVTIPAEKLKVNSKFVFKSQGLISDTGNPAVQFRISLGGVLIGDTGANSLGAISDDHWFLSLEFVIRTEGATGTLVAAGGFLTSQNDHFALVNASPVVIDTTADQIIDFTIEWGAANAANTITAQITEIHEVSI